MNKIEGYLSADDIIRQCLNLKNPKSFFLFAGAGSGKTRSLINALLYIKDEYGNYLKTQKRNVAVITYTNAACNEIKERLNFDMHFNVSTVHSFVWELIQNFQRDIKIWIKSSIESD